ncbi:MAG: MFS transporter [Roseibium sp.]
MNPDQQSLTIELLKDPRTTALLLAATLVVMAIATISPALSGLEGRFQNEPHAELLTRLLVPAPSLAVVLLAPFAGAAADRFGKVRVLLIGVALFVLAGTAGFYLPSLISILVSRLVLGATVALIMTSHTALIGECFEGERRLQIMGWQVSARNFGGFAFISVGGILASVSPQMTFLAYGIAGLFIPFIWFAFRNHKTAVAVDHRQVDQQAVDHSWIVPVMGISFFVCITVVTFFQMPTQLPFYMEQLGLESASSTTIVLGVMTLSGGVAALWTGWLKRMIGNPGLLSLGYAVMALGFGVLSASSELIPITVAAAFIGIGFAILMPTFTALLLDIAPANRRGTATGALAAGTSLGQVLSPFISLPIVSSFGYETAFMSSTVLLVLLSGIALVGKSLWPNSIFV